MQSQSQAWFTLHQKMQTWYSIYQFTHWFTLKTGDNDLINIFHDNSMSSTSFIVVINITISL